MHAARFVGRFIVPFAFALALQAADEWPQGYIVEENSISPDQRYGIVLPSRETGADVEGEGENTNYFADLKANRLLGKIEGADYFQGQNHRGLDVTWSKNSKFAVVVYQGRFGFWSAVVFEMEDSRFTQTDIGSHIHKAIDSVIAKQTQHRDSGADASPLFRFEPGAKIRVYGTATTNPKQFEDVKTYYALFQGLFDVTSKKWIASAARPLSSDRYDKLERASSSYDSERFKVSPDGFQGLDGKAEEPQFSGNDMLFRSEESKLKYLDDHMNDVYQAVGFLLPPAHFAKVKEEQIEWLKKRDASSSIAEKSKLTEERTKVLDDLAW